MNNAKQLTVVCLIGLVSGFVGALIAIFIMRHNEKALQSADVIRARQFEAVTTNGLVRARFGAKSGDDPSLELFGPDGSKRLSLVLDNVDEPLIMLRDSKENIRVVLGHVTSDTASLEDDNWALSFQVSGPDDTVADFGMVKRTAPLNYKGTAAVRKQGGQWNFLMPK